MIGDVAAMMFAFGLALVLGHNPPVRLTLFWHYRWGLLILLSLGVLLAITLDTYSLHRLPHRFLYQSVLFGVGQTSSALLATFVFFITRVNVPRAVLLLFIGLS